MMADNIKLFGDSRSGNCYKVQLLCAELGIDYTWVEVDIIGGETRTAEFLAMNANGKIPLLAMSGERYLAESNAILCYLADGTPLFGGNRFERAKILQWMFFEQYSHEPNIATSRFIIQYLGNPPERAEGLARRQEPGYRALEVMDRQLQYDEFMAGPRYSVADIALFAYTHVAHEGGFDLEKYQAINAWLERVRSRPGFVRMKAPG